MEKYLENNKYWNENQKNTFIPTEIFSIKIPFFYITLKKIPEKKYLIFFISEENEKKLI